MIQERHHLHCKDLLLPSRRHSSTRSSTSCRGGSSSTARFSSEPSAATLSTNESTTNTATDSTTTSTTTSTTSSSSTHKRDKPSWKDDGFVFGLESSGLQRPKGKVAQVVVEGDSLETQLYQQVMVYATLTAQAVFAAASLHDMYALSSFPLVVTTMQTLALLSLSYLLADFGSGVLHWSVDNYGNGRTPVFGSIISAFQGHHAAPWTITQREFANNVYKLCIPFGVLPLSIIYYLSSYQNNTPSIALFFTSFCFFELMSQEFHKWSHQLSSETLPWIRQLQKWGLVIGPKPHAQHHMEPFEGNYCIISGLCNPWLDESGFFRKLEVLIYRWNGVEPNCWKLNTELREKTLQGDFTV